MKIKGIFIPKGEGLKSEVSEPLKEKNTPSSILPKEVKENNLTNFQKVMKNNLPERLNKILSSYKKALKIEIDKDLKIPVYKIIDLETQEVIKQIPLEDILKLKKAIFEVLNKEIKNSKLKGIFLEKEA
jgi:flagellar protein FlaG